MRVFCDFGKEFEVSDPTGEEPKEIFIQTITQVVSPFHRGKKKESFFRVRGFQRKRLFQPTVCSVSVVPLQGSPGVVTCMDNQPHGLQTGQSVIFKEVNGMVELNGTSRQVSGTRNLHDVMIRSSQFFCHTLCLFVCIKYCSTYQSRSCHQRLCV